MKDFLSLLKEKHFPNEKSLGGFFIGEKVLTIANIEKVVYVCGNFVTASKLKKGLADCGKRAQIVSCGRENEDEFDQNLLPFAENISKYISNEVDCLIFLPSSVETKFDFEFLKQRLSISTGEEFSREMLSDKLVEFGYERVDYVTSVGQFAVRGEIVDIFIVGQDYPNRIEYFDDEIERIISFDFATMKTEASCQRNCC